MTATEIATREFLEDMGLQRIIQVDDANAEDMTFDHVWDTAATLSEADWNDLGVVLGGSPAESWRSSVKSVWDDLDDPNQKEFAAKALHATGRLTSEHQDADRRFQAALRSLMPNTEFQAISLQDWRTNSAKLIEDARTTPTLVLFDLEFERESSESRYGVTLLKNHSHHSHIYLGILSHHPSVAQEPTAWTSISAETSVPLERFVVLSKSRLTSDDPTLILDGFRRAMLCGHIARVKATCRAILETSVEDAKKDLDSINIYDFDQAIFRSSRQEGVWEGDTYFRLFNATVRRHAQRAMRRSTELQGQITQIRRKFPIRVDQAVQRTAWKLHKSEVYEDRDFVNEHLLPLSNGDIFQVRKASAFKDDDDLFVLVVQPCDLAVRDSGLRYGENGEPKFSHFAYLVEILQPAKGIPAFSEVTAPTERADGSSRTTTNVVEQDADLVEPILPTLPVTVLDERLKLAMMAYDTLSRRVVQAEAFAGARFELPYFGEDSPASRHMAVTRLHHAWLAALDLCALNPSGEACLALDAPIENELLLPGWRVRSLKLQSHFHNLLKLIPPDLSQVRYQDLASAILPKACQSRTVKVQIDGSQGGRVLKYGIRRVGRLAPDRAAALLGRVAAHISRPGFEHDLAREDNTSD